MSRSRGRLESSIESSFLRKMKELGIKTRKMNGDGFRAWPDRMVVVGGKEKVCFIEFKRTTNDKPTELQEDIHEMLRSQRLKVLVTSDWREAVDWVISLTSPSRPHKE